MSAVADDLRRLQKASIKWTHNHHMAWSDFHILCTAAPLNMCIRKWNDLILICLFDYIYIYIYISFYWCYCKITSLASLRKCRGSCHFFHLPPNPTIWSKEFLLSTTLILNKNQFSVMPSAPYTSMPQTLNPRISCTFHFLGTKCGTFNSVKNFHFKFKNQHSL
jgi:hypothetical protein